MRLVVTTLITLLSFLGFGAPLMSDEPAAKPVAKPAPPKPTPVTVFTPAAGVQAGQTFTSPRGDALKYLIFQPGKLASQEKWPLILFLHGAGECGEDLALVKIHGPPKLVEQRPDDFPFIVVSPQAPPAQDRPYVDHWDVRLLEELLDHVVKTFPVDSDRIYLTGLSMGGFGTLRLAARNPNRFAAVAPICGGGWPHYGEPLQKMPIWFFHGEKDTVVTVEMAQMVIEGIKKKGGKPLVTIYPGVGHDSWTETYNNPELYTWMLKHKASDHPLPKKEKK